MGFLRAEKWEGVGVISHGFGTRGQWEREITRRDRQQRILKENGQVLPLIGMRQVHGDRVVVFDGSGKNPGELGPLEGDALISQDPGYALSVFTADCLPILLFDPIGKVIGIVHAGWRGTAKGISRKAVQSMADSFRCRRENIEAALGPAIGPCCFEVDAPVEQAFAEGGLPWRDISNPKGKGKWLLDLRKANSYLLHQAGLRREKIQSLDLCTSCRRDLFYSYRAERGTRGRHLNYIALRPE